MSASLFAQAMREFFHHHQAWPAQYFEERLEFVYSRILEPGDAAIDVGAHVGYHSERILKKIGPSGQIICIEPLPEIFQRLKSELSLATNARLFNCVLSDQPGQITFQHAVGLPGESGLRKRVRYDIPDVELETIKVESRVLDDLARDLKTLKYIKIDTEGAELTILGAGERVLRELRPVVSVEWGSDTYQPYGHDARSLFSFARGRGYSIFDLFTNMIGSEREWLEVSDRAAWDFILVPDEKIAWFVYAQNA